MARWLYTIAWLLALPLAFASLLWRARSQPGYLSHPGERFGRHRARAGAAPLLWVHAVSVGETRAAQPLVAALLERYPEHEVLVTHMTPTGRATGAALFADPRVHQAWLPYDVPFALRRFLRAWRPSLGIVVETELWPNLVAVARREGVPLALVSARLSERSLRKGQRWGALIRPALASLDLVLAQTPDDARRLALLGRAQAPVVGNLKFDVRAEPSLEARGHGWRAAWLAGGPRPAQTQTQTQTQPRPCVVAASTREGEEALLLDAWAERVPSPAPADASASPDSPRPLLAIVPRHPQRFDEVAALVQACGWRLARRSRLAGDERCDADVLLGDSMGEMAAYYALADVAIIGGSLLPHGGQNLIEACAAGVPVVIGPHTFNFAQAVEQAIDADAAVRAPDAAQAVSEALALVAEPVRRQSTGERALAFAERHRGATARTLAALAPLIERPRRAN